MTSSSVEVWGHPRTQIDYTIDTCPEQAPCSIQIEGLNIWWYQEFSQNRLPVVNVPGGPIGVDIGAYQANFDQYWTEVAEPILASIEFVDG